MPSSMSLELYGRGRCLTAKTRSCCDYYPTREAWILEDDGETTLWPMKAGPAGAVRKILTVPPAKSEHGLDDARDSLSS